MSDFSLASPETKDPNEGPFCYNCRHHNKDESNPWDKNEYVCLSPRIGEQKPVKIGVADLITGYCTQIGCPMSCVVLRQALKNAYGFEMCGPKGAWFEPFPVTKPVVPPKKVTFWDKINMKFLIKKFFLKNG